MNEFFNKKRKLDGDYDGKKIITEAIECGLQSSGAGRKYRDNYFHFGFARCGSEIRPIPWFGVFGMRRKTR